MIAKVVVYFHHTMQRNKNHQGNGMIISKLTMDQHGTRKETSIEAHEGLNVEVVNSIEGEGVNQYCMILSLLF
jgi:hypothetical protein